MAPALRSKVGLFDLAQDEGAIEFVVDRAEIVRGGWLFRIQDEGFVSNLAFENHAEHGPCVLVQRNEVVSVATTKNLPRPITRCKIIVNWSRAWVQVTCGWGRWVQDTGRVPAPMPPAPPSLLEAAAAADTGSEVRS